MTAVTNQTAASASESGSGRLSTDELVRQHLPLVGHLVREALARVPQHVLRDDLMSAAMFGLASAAASFDPERGASFAGYAAIRVRGAIADELRDRDWLSRSGRVRARGVEAARADLAANLQRTPKRAEIAAALGMSVDEVAAAEADAQRASISSLDAITAESGELPLPSTGEDPAALLVRREQIGYLRDAIAELPERLRIVVEGHFFQHRKLAEIAQELGVTESRASQLRSDALGMLRLALQATEDAQAPEPEIGSGRRPAAAAARAAYCAAVASRSNVAGRLAATTVLGESRNTIVAVG